MKKIKLLFILLVGLATLTSAQDLQRLTLDVFQDNVKLLNPLAGGLKSPQFSEVDLNGDGIQDLFIFDKAGNVRLTFINGGTPNQVDYKYAPFYSQFFPDLTDWVLLRDYNGDGIMDIFAQYQSPAISGIVVYTGRFENNHLAFDQFNFHQLSENIIPIPTGSNNFTQLFVSLEDIPAIDDINGDGDLDILTFSDGGGLVYLYENQSVELGFNKDSLIYRRVDDCWGKFYETGVTNCLVLSDDPNNCADGFTSGEVHPGSTLLTFDDNNDGDKELLLGDISFQTMVFAINDGTSDRAYVVNQDCTYPSTDVPVDIKTFPSSFLLDVDNDGLKDLIATANTDNIGVSFKSVWFYKNVTSNEFPEFKLQTKDFMIDKMLQFGLGSNPTFVDYNADGLLDIVVGNLRFNSTDLSNLFLLENVGTAKKPAFEVVDEDWLGFKDLFATTSTRYNFVTAFGDIDGDGDEDLFVGDDTGSLLFAENIAGAGNTMSFGPIQGNYMSLDPGQASAPEIVDIDGDGLLDILIGERTVNADPNDVTRLSNIVFYKNIGTATAPMFNSDLDAPENNPFFGRVNTIVVGLGSSGKGEASPAIFDTGDDFILFTGSSSGRIMVYDQITANLDGAFNEVDRNYGDLKIGIQTRIDVADINDDGFIDLVVGNKRGGISMYATNFRIDGTVSVGDIAPSSNLLLFPNPASATLNLQWETQLAQTEGEVVIFDALGREVERRFVQVGNNEITVADWPTGIYFADLRVGGERVVKRFVVSD